jgi:N-methylhydantoinase A
VPVDGSLAKPGSEARLLKAFEDIYERRYGRGTGSTGAVVEITNCHVQLVRVLPKATLSPQGPSRELNPHGSRRIYYLEDWMKVPVYLWEELPHGSSFTGPALVDAAGTTVWVNQNYVARVDTLGNLFLKVNQ